MQYYNLRVTLIPALLIFIIPLFIFTPLVSRQLVLDLFNQSLSEAIKSLNESSTDARTLLRNCSK